METGPLLHSQQIKIHIVVLLITMCNVVGGYKHFRRTWFLHFAWNTSHKSGWLYSLSCIWVHLSNFQPKFHQNFSHLPRMAHTPPNPVSLIWNYYKLQIMHYSPASFPSCAQIFSHVSYSLTLSVSFPHMEIQKTHTGIKKWMVSYNSFAHFPF